jgi:hypothetical protein
MEEMTTFWVNERNTAEDWNEVSRSLCKSGMQKEKSFRSSKSTESKKRIQSDEQVRLYRNKKDVLFCGLRDFNENFMSHLTDHYH